MSERAHEQEDVGTKVHGDKLEQAIPRDGEHAGHDAAGHDAAGPGAAGAAPGGRPRGAREGINPDHPDRTSEPGTGGLMPGSYEQAGGEAGRTPGGEGKRAP